MWVLLLLLLLLAAVFFALAAFNAPIRANMVAAGLLAWVLVPLIQLLMRHAG